jgi:glycosyl transferase family 87
MNAAHERAGLPGTRRALSRTTLLFLLVLVLAIAAAQRLVDGAYRLVWDPSGAGDLGIYHHQVYGWFAGHPIQTEQAVTYPPASFALLWPLVGWLPLSAARVLWAVTTAAALTWLVAQVVRASGSPSRLERVAVALFPLAVYATRAVIVNGQVALHLLPALIAGLILLDRGRPGWGRDLGAAALILLGLVKPTVAVPFLWLVILARGWLRPTLLIGLGYLALTIVAAAFQPASLLTLLRQWLEVSVSVAATASVGAHANLHSWLGWLGRPDLVTPLSLAGLALLGWWMYKNRGDDIWIRLGVAALVARFWSFHYRYDDVLILVPTIALLRLTAGNPSAPGARMAARALLVLTAATMLAPARLFFIAWPWTALFEAAQTTVWLGVLAFLASYAGRERAASARGAAAI